MKKDGIAYRLTKQTVKTGGRTARKKTGRADAGRKTSREDLKRVLEAASGLLLELTPDQMSEFHKAVKRRPLR